MCGVFTARTQPIIRNATADMLKEHILPVAEKLKAEATKREAEEETYLQEKRRGGELGDSETLMQEVTPKPCRRLQTTAGSYTTPR